MSITYTLKQSEGESEPFILKTGHEVSFSMSEVRTNREQLLKATKELAAQVELESAKMTNVEGFHEIVKTLDDLQLTAIQVYAEAKAKLEAYKAKLEEIEAQIAKDDKELEEIEKQTGLSL